MPVNEQQDYIQLINEEIEHKNDAINSEGNNPGENSKNPKSIGEVNGYTGEKL